MKMIYGCPTFTLSSDFTMVESSAIVGSVALLMPCLRSIQEKAGGCKMPINSQNDQNSPIFPAKTDRGFAVAYAKGLTNSYERKSRSID